LAAHGFFAIFEENLNFLRPNDTLNNAKTKNRVINKGLKFVSIGHGIGLCFGSVHAGLQSFPFFAIGIFRFGGFPYSGLFRDRGWPVFMLTFTGVALNFKWGFFFQSNDDVVGVFAAFGAAGFNLVTD